MSYPDNERLDRIEHHLRLLKDNDERQTETLTDIKSALIGSYFNGNKGIVNQLQEITKRVSDIEMENSVVQTYVKQSKFVIGAIVLLLLGILVQSIMNGDSMQDVKRGIENTK